MNELTISQNVARDEITISGRTYTGAFFRFLSPSGAKQGTLYEIIRNDGKEIEIRQFALNGLLRFIVLHWPRKANNE
jgi:hypothetical protein